MPFLSRSLDCCHRRSVCCRHRRVAPPPLASALFVPRLRVLSSTVHYCNHVVVRLPHPFGVTFQGSLLACVTVSARLFKSPLDAGFRAPTSYCIPVSFHNIDNTMSAPKVDLLLCFDNKSNPALSIPLDQCQIFATRPLKWLRFLGFAIYGQQGHLSKSENGPELDYTEQIEARSYYYISDGQLSSYTL